MNIHILRIFTHQAAWETGRACGISTISAEKIEDINYKSIALWEYFWYYIKAFRTGTDFPPCGRTSRLGGGVEVPGGKNKYLEEMKCQ